MGNSPPDSPVSLALAISGVGTSDPFTLDFSEPAKWNTELMKLLGPPTQVY